MVGLVALIGALIVIGSAMISGHRVERWLRCRYLPRLAWGVGPLVGLLVGLISVARWFN
jgi:hypothetical protein